MAFDGIYALRYLSIVRTGLGTMPPLSPVKSTLQTLGLAYNIISQVPQDFFNDFVCLNTLDMRGNILHQIPNVTPLQFSLTSLYLNQNSIDTIQGVLTRNQFPLLQYIQLISNNISRFDLNMVSSWPVLESLSLHDNHISVLPVISPEDGNSTCDVDRDTICSLYFLGNPINCSVAVNEIIKRRERTHTAYLDCHIAISSLGSTHCKTPPYLCGRDLATLGNVKPLI